MAKEGPLRYSRRQLLARLRGQEPQSYEVVQDMKNPALLHINLFAGWGQIPQSRHLWHRTIKAESAEEAIGGLEHPVRLHLAVRPVNPPIVKKERRGKLTASRKGGTP